MITAMSAITGRAFVRIGYGVALVLAVLVAVVAPSSGSTSFAAGDKTRGEVPRLLKSAPGAGRSVVGGQIVRLRFDDELRIQEP